MLNGQQKALLLDLYAGKKHTVGEICQLVGGISKQTFYKYVNAEKAMGHTHGWLVKRDNGE
jgi:hypothetical protein